MKKIVLISLLLIFPVQIFATDKSEYDLTEQNVDALPMLNKGGFYETREVATEWLDVTLISGGYFTIGTSKGLSDKTIDDNCAVTFGHPYALTSYPVFSVDGVWYRLDEYFGTDALTPAVGGDTLSVQSFTDKFSISFMLVADSSSARVDFHYNVTNNDTQSHTLGLGIVLDPALGKWGDGHLEATGGFLDQDTVMYSAGSTAALRLWEKQTGQKGLGVDIFFPDEQPELVVAANWPDVYMDAGPEYEPGQLRGLYDLTLKMYWSEQSVGAGESRNSQTVVALAEPDFNSASFMRWDMPAFLSLNNNLMFPRMFDTYAEITSLSSQPVGNGSLQLSLPSTFDASRTEYNISLPANDRTQHKITLHSNIVYEDKIEEVTLRFVDNGEIVDELRRNVFIPATPVSDSGLSIVIDTLITEDFPQVSFSFEVRNEEKDFLITNIENENIFLFENDERITDFVMGHDTTGGIEAADFVFVLDVTGSMSDEIDAVKSNIIEFADSLSYRGVDFQLGLVTFLDVIENVYPFTRNVQQFQTTIGQQRAHGGGDYPENSLDALLEASRFPYRPQAKRIVIWITDASYHENNSITSLSKSEVINALLANNITVHSVGNSREKSSYYDPITIATGGNYYDIDGNFRDILLDISRLRALAKYLLRYQSTATAMQMNQLRLEIKYAGLGGHADIEYEVPGTNQVQKRLSFFPNPFNPTITFNVEKNGFSGGNIQIFNLLGQTVIEIPLDGLRAQSIVWNARDGRGTPISTGFYVVRLALEDDRGRTHYESARILYLK